MCSERSLELGALCGVRPPSPEAVGVPHLNFGGEVWKGLPLIRPLTWRVYRASMAFEVSIWMVLGLDSAVKAWYNMLLYDDPRKLVLMRKCAVCKTEYTPPAMNSEKRHFRCELVVQEKGSRSPGEYRFGEVTPGMCPELTVPGPRGCDRLTECIYQGVHFSPDVQELLF